MPSNEPLRQRTSPLTMSSQEFREIGTRLIHQIADFLDSIPQRPVTPAESPSTVRALLQSERSLPPMGTDSSQLLQQTASLLFDHSLLNAHPRFWGYVTSSPAPIGTLGELLAAAINQNCGAWLLSPMASEIEAQTIHWIAEMLAYPTTGTGIFVSGGNMANIVGFLAARRAKAGIDIRTRGIEGSRLRLYCSRETHTWIQKAADISGIGTDAIRWIDADSKFRIDLQALRNAINADLSAGDRPFLVVGNAGTVGTGAVDPLSDLAAIAREFDLWFHIDGAYGALAAVVPSAAPEFHGMAEADSLAVDPHKWLYAPLEAGCTLVKDPGTLRAAFSYHPPYYHFGDEATNYFDLGPQNSRGFRALKVWLAFQQVGRAGFEQMISDDMRLSSALFDLIPQYRELERLSHALSITTFRYIPPDLEASPDTSPYLDRLNREILTRLQASGQAYLSNAIVHGKYALRCCIVNFRTTLADIEALPPLVVSLGNEVDSTLRMEVLGAGKH